jgi:nucleoid DNA-binding protein
MTKRDLVVRISEETGLVQQDVLNVVQKTLDYISDAVTKGQKVELRNFGVFEVKVRKARVGRNPNAPEADVPIPPEQQQAAQGSDGQASAGGANSQQASASL